MATNNLQVNNVTEECANESEIVYSVLTEFVSGLHDYFYNYLVMSSVGGVFSLLSLAAPISLWTLLPKTRNFQNYIALNQCITAAVSPFIISLIVTFTFDMICDAQAKLAQATNDNCTEQKDFYSIAVDYSTPVFVYVQMSSCCWTTAAAVLCYIQVVIVFASEVPRKYLIVNTICYGIPAVIVGLQGLATISSLHKKIIMLSTAAILAAVNTCIYLVVIIAIFKGKKPGRDETVRSITTALFIFVIFGLWFSIGWVVLLILSANTSEKLLKILDSDSPTMLHDLTQSLDEFRVLYVLSYIQVTLVSTHALVLSAFYVMGGKATRTLWVKQLCRKYSPNAK